MVIFILRESSSKIECILNFEYKKMSFKMEIELDNGLRLKINEIAKTSTVIKLNQKSNDVFIPRYAEYKDEKYKIISINSYAFSNVDLELLHFADDSEVEYFDRLTFFSSSIKKLQIPVSLTKIHDEWIYDIKSISDFEVSPKNRRFKYYEGNFLLYKSEEDSDEFDSLIYARYNIEDAVIPQEVKIVKKNSFSGHPNLKSITFPENSKLKIIEYHSFDSTPLQKLVLPANVEKIGGSNFQNIKNLVDIEISPKNKHFKIFDNKYLLTKSDTSIQTFDVLFFVSRDIQVVQIPSQIKVISDFAIHQCKKLKSITFEPNSSLEIINSYSISNNSNLTKMIFPKSVKIFGDYSLSVCENLTSIEILGSSIQLKYCCFNSCKKLESITFPNATEIEFGKYFINFSDKAKFYVLHEAKLTGEEYKEIKSRIKYIKKKQASDEISHETREADKTEDKNKIENEIESASQIKPIDENQNDEYNEIDEKKDERQSKYNDVDFLMKHIRYLERSLREFKKNNKKEEKSLDNFFIGTEEENTKYETVEVIGEGNTSIVEKVIDKTTNKPVCKKTLKGETATFKDVKNAIKEFELLYSMGHPSICRGISINTQEELDDGNTTIAIFIEFIDFKLTDFIKSSLASNTLKTRIVVDISHGMRYIHSKIHIYRDLNINNIMLNSVFEAKLIDFGLARMNEKLFGEETMSTYSLMKNVGMDVFMSPEMFNGDEYDNKTDVYSFGVVVYYIFVGELPKQTINDIIKGKTIELPKESRSISKACIELISKCLSFDPKDRPTFDEIIEFIRKNKYMLSSDVDPTIVSQRDNELEMIES